MRVRALADTGALLALLDRNDRWHGRCAEAFTQLRLPLVTTVAVLTELFHLVGGSGPEVEAAWRFVRGGALTVHPLTDADLASLDALMSKYRDRPMDLADATLVLVGEQLDLRTVFTVDVGDFETYRLSRRRSFRIVPAPSPA